jgi:hypothetical protein
MNFLRAALAYAELGFHVLPIAPGGKLPLCPRGEHDASRDRLLLEQWGRRWPRANIAIAPARSGFFVLDIDVRNFGDESLMTLPVLPATATALTGGGGFHLWFQKTPALHEIRRSTLPVEGVDVSGIDIKGLRSGYVVAPPSLHASGRRYAWEASSRIDEHPIALPPSWLVGKIVQGASRAIVRQGPAVSVKPEAFYLGMLFKRAGWLGQEVKPGVFAVRCPNESYHTSGKPFDSSTVIFAPRPGARDRRGTFYCSHASRCAEVWR